MKFFTLGLITELMDMFLKQPLPQDIHSLSDHPHSCSNPWWFVSFFSSSDFNIITTFAYLPHVSMSLSDPIPPPCLLPPTIEWFASQPTQESNICLWLLIIIAQFQFIETIYNKTFKNLLFSHEFTDHTEYLHRGSGVRSILLQALE